MHHYFACVLGLSWSVLAVAPASTPVLSATPAPVRESSTTRQQSLVAWRDTASKPQAVTLAFQDVTVIDVTDGRLLPGQTVVVAGNRIQALGPANQVRVPQGTQVVDARGKYLIPGLWDMHTHTYQSNRQRIYRDFIAYGVTGVRELAQRDRKFALVPTVTDSFRAWQRDIMTGTRVGPRTVGPSADLTDNAGAFQIATPADARRIIDSLTAAGMVFLKYHDDMGDPDLFFTIMREARRVGLPVAGHVPQAVTNVEAADSGLQVVEHLVSNHQCWPNWREPLEDSVTVEKKCAPVVEAYLRHGTWIVPTLIGLTYNFSSSNATGMCFRRTLMGDHLRLARMMYRSGFRKFLPGTDQGGHTVRGLSLLQELVIFVEGVGMPPLEALQAGTLRPAQFFNATDSLGTVAPGKLADLVLLDANPLTDIRNIMTVRAVVANGRYFDRAALDALNPDTVALIKAFVEQHPVVTLLEEQTSASPVPRPC